MEVEKHYFCDYLERCKYYDLNTVIVVALEKNE